MHLRSLLLVAAVVTAVAAMNADAAQIVVDAQSNIFFAGSATPPDNGTLPPSFAVSGGDLVAFASVTGTVNIAPGAPFNGADGGTFASNTNINSRDGISGLIHTNRNLFLAGVFIGDDVPSAPAPPRLSFTDPENFDLLAPLVGQTFFIGDGRRDDTAAQQQFLAPAGATRLFLGFIDGVSGNAGAYSDNSGSLTADLSVVPEPATAGLLGAAGLLALLRRRLPKQRDGRGKRIVPLAVAGCVGTLVVAASAPAVLGQTTTVVVQSGDAVPDGNGSFLNFTFVRPTLNDAGQAGFFARLGGSGVTSANDAGLYRGDGVTLVRLAREGQSAPNGPGAFDSFPSDPLAFNGAGQAGFFARLGGSDVTPQNTTGLYRSDGLTLVQIVRAGQIAPDGPGVFTGFSINSSTGFPNKPLALNEAGQVGFAADFGGSGVASSNNTGLYRGDGATLVQIARKGQESPAGSRVNFASFGTPALNEVGQTAFAANLDGPGNVSSTTNSGIYRGDGAMLVQIAREGQIAPGGSSVFRDLGNPVLNSSGQAAFNAFLGDSGANSSNGRGIYRGDGTTLVQIAREGQAAPSGPGVNFSSLQLDPVLNDLGQTAFFAFLSGTGVTTTNNSGLFRGDDAALVQIVRRGQVAPDGLGSFSGFADPVLNNSGQAAFFAGLDGTDVDSSNRNGIFFYDDILGLLTVARTGDTFLGSTITDLRFSSGGADERDGFNNLGQVAYGYTLADGSSGIAIFSIPEPSSLALLGLGGFTLLRRRRPKQRDGRGKGIVPLAVVGCVGTLVAATSAPAAVLTGPVTNPANGHDYFLLTQDTWTNSEAEAVTLGGHLATINDAAENAYVFNTFANFGGNNRNLWIGLNDVAAEGTFVWTSGETPGYTNWSPGQPDNTIYTTGPEPDEDYVLIVGPQGFSGLTPSQWNDGRSDPALFSSVTGPVNAVVEVVPEPAAGLLATAGLLVLLRRRR